PAAGATHESDFTNTKRRKIIMQHEALRRRFAGLEQLDPLLVILGSQGDCDQRLGFAASEQRRAVRPRQQARFDRNGTDLVKGPAVRTAPLAQHLLTEDLLFKDIEDLAGFDPLLFRQRFESALLERSYLGV